MFCGKCGRDNADEARFCVHCGADLAKMTPPSASAPSEDENQGTDETVEDTDALRAQVLDVSERRSPTPSGGGSAAPHMVPVESLRPGRVLAGRYKIVQRLGVGGMGEVFKATDGELDGLPVAIKVLPPILATNARSVNRLRTEAAISLKLTHPNICRLHTFRVDGDVKFLVMEYIEGQTLEELLDSMPERRLSVDRLLPIAHDVAQALDFAHGLQPPILHRDIKPSNVMVSSSGRGKVLDFGIARELKDSMTRMTGKDTSGTLLYMSPEQFTGSTPTAASDIYSFSAMMYECLAGHAPFWQGSIAHQLLNQQPGDIPGAPETLNRALKCGLAKNGAERPPTAAALLEMMEGKTEPKPVSAKPAEFTVAAKPAKDKPARSGRRGLLAWGVVLLIALAALGVVGVKQGWWPDPFDPPATITDVVAAQDNAERKRDAIQAVDPGQRLGLRLKEVEALFRTAEDQTTREQYAAAIGTYEEIARRCDTIRELDEARAEARELMADATAARSEAETSGAKGAASALWEQGITAATAAADLFEQGRFEEAGSSLSSATNHFREATVLARSAAEVQAAKAVYAEKVAGIDANVLDRYGGAAWQAARRDRDAADRAPVGPDAVSKWEAAVASLETAWQAAVQEKADSEAVAAFLREARENLAREEYADATEQVNRALSIQPECLEAKVLGERIGAVSVSTLAVELADSDPAEALACADQAVLKLSSVLSLAPDDPEAKGRLQRMKDLVARLEGLYRLERRLEGHTGWVNTVAFGPGGKEVVTGSRDRTLIVWDVASGRKLRTISAAADVVSAAFSPDGSLLAWAMGPRVAVAPADGGEPQLLEGHLLSVLGLAFSPDGRRVVTCSSDDSARVWGVSDGACLHVLEHGADVNCAGFSPDGRRLVTGSADGRVQIWNAAGAWTREPLAEEQAAVLTVACSADGSVVAAGDGSGVIRLWQTSTKAPAWSAEGHRGGVSSLAFDPTGGYLASAGGDRAVRLWDIKTGRCVQTLKGHTDWVRCVAFSPSGNQLASGGDDKTLILWQRGLRARSGEHRISPGPK